MRPSLRGQIPPASSSLSFLHSVDQQVFSEALFSPPWWDGLNGIAQRKAPVPPTLPPFAASLLSHGVFFFESRKWKRPTRASWVPLLWVTPQ